MMGVRRIELTLRAGSQTAVEVGSQADPMALVPVSHQLPWYLSSPL
jgi:hypothetical protein